MFGDIILLESNINVIIWLDDNFFLTFGVTVLSGCMITSSAWMITFSFPFVLIFWLYGSISVITERCYCCCGCFKSCCCWPRCFVAVAAVEAATNNKFYILSAVFLYLPYIASITNYNPVYINPPLCNIDISHYSLFWCPSLIRYLQFCDLPIVVHM
jgi:hypothetical protein